jgi:hypothetical protein
MADMKLLILSTILFLIPLAGFPIEPQLAPSSTPLAEKHYPRSTVFKKTPPIRFNSEIRNGTLSERTLLTRDPALYDRLNAELFGQGNASDPSHSDNIPGTLVNLATKACAGVAAAQVLGVIPSEKPNPKK